ncbi:MAG: site-2 protease family protein [Spirochaetota bacterium]|nr:site-2 protease family protein [Spirochaetota bacterium]
MEIVKMVIYSVLGLGFLVLIHELGHLIIARLTGIGVEAFSIFFGRPIYSFKWRSIDWRVGWIPFGGYCKMKGQEDFGEAKSKGEPDEFYQRPPWARLLTVLAGPTFNILLGIILLGVIVFIAGDWIKFNGKITVKHQIKEQIEGLPKGFAFPKEFDKRLKYNPKNQILAWKGTMSVTDKDKLLILYNDKKYKQAINKFYEKQDKVLKDGDIITKVNGKSITQTIRNKELLTENKLMRYLQDDGLTKEKVILTVNREGAGEVQIDYPVSIKSFKNGLGFSITDPTESIFGKDRATVSIQGVIDDSPADKAGLKERDIILSIDGKVIKSYKDVSTFINQGNEDLSHSFLVLRDGKEIEIKDVKPQRNTYIKEVKESNKSGLQDNDKVITINGKEIKSVEHLKSVIESSKDNIEFLVKRNDNDIMVTVNKGLMDQVKIETKKQIGITPFPGVHKNYSLFESIPIGIKTGIGTVILQFRAMGKMDAHDVQENVSGPVGIFKHIGKVSAYGFGAYFKFLAIISILLGVFNLLPIPAVDGGHVVLTFYEIIRRKPISAKVVQRIQIVGVFIIITLAVVFTFNDIYNWITKG